MEIAEKIDSMIRIGRGCSRGTGVGIVPSGDNTSGEGTIVYPVPNPPVGVGDEANVGASVAVGATNVFVGVGVGVGVIQTQLAWAMQFAFLHSPLKQKSVLKQSRFASQALLHPNAAFIGVGVGVGVAVAPGIGVGVGVGVGVDVGVGVGVAVAPPVAAVVGVGVLVGELVTLPTTTCAPVIVSTTFAV